MKKITALFAAFCLFVSIVPISAFATGAVTPPTGDAPSTTLKEISGFTEPDVIEIANGDTRTEEEIISAFPAFMLATVDGAEDTEVPVSGWSRVFPTADIDFSAAVSGEYFYEPTLVEGYTLSAEVGYLQNQLVKVGELTHEPQPMADVGDFTVTGDSSNYSYADGVLTITGDGELIIANTNQSTPTKHRIVVNVGVSANLTLNGVNIDLSGTTIPYSTHSAIYINDTATATITLADNSTNTLKGGSDGVGAPGLEVPNGATLILKGTNGSLSATSAVNGAGIGGRRYQSSGTITISGGHITATGANGGAGIGGGASDFIDGRGNGGITTISGGTVVATGNSGGAGIGGGGATDHSVGGNGGIITISGGNVTAQGNNGGAGIGGGSNGAKVDVIQLYYPSDAGSIIISDDAIITLAQGGFSGAGIGAGRNGTAGNITISGNAKIIMAQGGEGAAGIGGGLNGTDGEDPVNATIKILGGTVTAQGGTGGGAGIGSGSYGEIDTITISGGTVSATGNSGAGIGGGNKGKVNSITISGTAVITMAQGGERSAGIGGGKEGDNETSIIKIEGGTVTASGGEKGAGIGGGYLCTGGIITISGGTVTAAGGKGAAGIGGGGPIDSLSGDFSGGKITISGGTVSSTGGSGGAGIGGGQFGQGGDIIIEGTAKISLAQGGEYAAGIGGGSGERGLTANAGAGGTITIRGSAQIILAQGGSGGAGIGGGSADDSKPGTDAGTGGIIKIEGGTVTAKGGAGNSSGAGIGGGGNGQGGNITISGGAVTATGGSSGAGIGSGSSADGGNITISGGTLAVQGGYFGAGIGGGIRGSGGAIAISGGTISATGGPNGAGIGGGYVGNGGTITISGSAMITKAQGGENGAGIGGGYARPGGTITISGGTVALAQGGTGAAGIGDGSNVSTYYTPGTFSTDGAGGADGEAFIMASSISDNDDTSNWSGVIFGGDANDPNNGYFYGANNSFTLLADAEVPQDKTLMILSGETFSIGAGLTLTNNGTIFKTGTLTEIGTLVNNGIILPQDGLLNPIFSVATTSVFLRESGATTQYSLNNSDWFTYTGTVTLIGTTDENAVQVQSGEHDITLNDVNIDVNSRSNVSALDIDGSAVANITLRGINTLQSGSNAAGLQVEGSATLNITENSSGSLHATGGMNVASISGAAGIGGGHGGAGGTITISGGTVVAEGNFGGAGIGGGHGGAGGTVKITGGSVTATANDGGTGIGVGQGGATGGTLEIMGGTVTATGAGGARALSATPTYTLPTPSAVQIYSISIMAGATETGATAKTPSEDYVTGSNYVKIAMSTATPRISITPTKTLTYNGKEQTQNVSVKLGSVSLAEGTHYTISGNTATNAGNHTLTVTILPLGADGVYDTTAGTNYFGNGTTATASYSIAALPTTSSSTSTTTYNPAISPQTGVYN